MVLYKYNEFLKKSIESLNYYFTNLRYYSNIMSHMAFESPLRGLVQQDNKHVDRITLRPMWACRNIRNVFN